MSNQVAERPAEVESAEVQREEFVRPQFRSIPDKEAHELQVLMPGVGKDDVTVSLVDDQLTIVGRRSNRAPANWRPVFEEHDESDYRLRVRLNIKVDQERMTGRMEDGVLHLTLPIHEAAKPRRIQVD